MVASTDSMESTDSPKSRLSSLRAGRHAFSVGPPEVLPACVVRYRIESLDDGERGGIGSAQAARCFPGLHARSCASHGTHSGGGGAAGGLRAADVLPFQHRAAILRHGRPFAERHRGRPRLSPRFLTLHFYIEFPMSKVSLHKGALF